MMRPAVRETEHAAHIVGTDCGAGAAALRDRLIEQ